MRRPGRLAAADAHFDSDVDGQNAARRRGSDGDTAVPGRPVAAADIFARIRDESRGMD
jgi:hypothetical protein